MIVDRLVIHHTYTGTTAFDVSQNHHHGTLEGGIAPSGGVVQFQGGPDLVRVRRSPTLAEMRAVRTTIRFRLPPLGIDPGFSPQRRMNLIEGYISFALVIEPDKSLHGTILDRTGTWRGCQSAAGVLQPDHWHEATFVHDGFSACRIDLDGVTIAESFDALGPVTAPKDPYGIAIGHWPDPDDRYSLVGEIDDVKVWMNRPDAFVNVVDECCVDREGIDDLFDRLRGEKFDDPSFDPATYQAAAEAMMDLGGKTFGGIASGSEANRRESWDLARRFLLAFGSGDRDGFVETMAVATKAAAQRVPAATLEADAAALLDALHPTVLGPLIDAVMGGADEAAQARIGAKLGISDWLDAFCLGWGKPRPSDDRKPDDPDKPKDPKGHGDPTGPETTDRNHDDVPPSWGAGAEHHHDEELGDQT